MTDGGPGPVTTKWFNTDGGRAIIGATLVSLFMIIVAVVVLNGGQAEQSQQSGPPPSSPTASWE